MSAAQTWMDWLALKAGQCDLQLSLVGGAVRDQLLGRRSPDKDLDLVVEGPKRWPAVELAQAVEQARDLPSGFSLINHQCFEAFGTAQLQLNTPEGPLLCDLSSARREHYAFPGAHPEVSLTCLEEDLQRRSASPQPRALRSGAAGAAIIGATLAGQRERVQRVRRLRLSLGGHRLVHCRRCLGLPQSPRPMAPDR